MLRSSLGVMRLDRMSPENTRGMLKEAEVEATLTEALKKDQRRG